MEIHIENFKGATPILVWQFHEAPIQWQKMSECGGDEDWIAFVPDSFSTYYPAWLDNLGKCSVDKYKVDGGSIFIGSHA